MFGPLKTPPCVKVCSKKPFPNLTVQGDNEADSKPQLLNTCVATHTGWSVVVVLTTSVSVVLIVTVVVSKSDTSSVVVVLFTSVVWTKFVRVVVVCTVVEAVGIVRQEQAVEMALEAKALR